MYEQNQVIMNHDGKSCVAKCPKCGRIGECKKHDTHQKWVNRPNSEHASAVRATVTRYRCSCKATFSVSPYGVPAIGSYPDDFILYVRYSYNTRPGTVEALCQGTLQISVSTLYRILKMPLSTEQAAPPESSTLPGPGAGA